MNICYTFVPKGGGGNTCKGVTSFADGTSFLLHDVICTPHRPVMLCYVYMPGTCNVIRRRITHTHLYSLLIHKL